MNPTVFLGGGRITGALIAGLRLAGYKAPLVVHDRNLHKLRALRRQFHVAIEPDLARAIAQAGFLIIAVRPSDVLSLLAETRRAVSAMPRAKRRRQSEAEPPAIACCLAAGIPLVQLRAALPGPFGWARAMPSPVSRSGRGLTAVAFDRNVPAAARRVVKKFFAVVGPVLEIPERKFDIFTATYSCSHGYHALSTLARAAQRAGLDRRNALAAAAHALADGITSWREGNLSLEELLEEAATPGGIAATVMRTMDAHNYSEVVERGLRAGIARARQNAKKRKR
jgi:pyrroline-5-carboxylate reductase